MTIALFAAGTSWEPIIILVAIGGILAILLRSWIKEDRKNRQKRPSASGSSPERKASGEIPKAEQPAPLSQQKRNYIRELIQQLDERIEQTQELIDEADRAANRLEAVLGAIERTAASIHAPIAAAADTESGKAGRSSSPDISLQNLQAAIAGLADLEKEIYQINGNDTEERYAPDEDTYAGPMTDDETDDRPIEPPSALNSRINVPAADPSEAVTPDSTEPDPRFQEIYKLADSGITAGEIAEKLNMPIGKVMLILSLRGK